MAVQFIDGKVLFVDGKVAMSAACCCEEECICVACDENGVPNQLQVIITGITGSCSGTSCDSLFNKTFILDCQDGCFWTYFIGTNDCQVDLGIIATVVGDLLQIRVVDGFANTRFEWRTSTFSLPTNCAAWSSLTAAFHSHAMTGCFANSSSASITAL